MWPPNLNYYDRRIEILRRLEDRNALKAFRVSDESVGAELSGSSHRLHFTKNGMILQQPDPHDEFEMGKPAVDLAIELLQPRSVESCSLRMAYVEKIELSFDEALRSCYGTLLGELHSDGVRFDDWALLTDVRSENEEFQGQIEFGLVKADEVPGRLSGEHGRIRSSEPAITGVWSKSEFPDVSLYAEVSVWSSQIQTVENELSDGIFQFWSSTREEIDSLVTELSHRLFTEA